MPLSVPLSYPPNQAHTRRNRSMTTFLPTGRVLRSLVERGPSLCLKLCSAADHARGPYRSSVYCESHRLELASDSERVTLMRGP